jgi:hypothetical protein
MLINQLVTGHNMHHHVPEAGFKKSLAILGMKAITI